MAVARLDVEINSNVQALNQLVSSLRTLRTSLGGVRQESQRTASALSSAANSVRRAGAAAKNSKTNFKNFFKVFNLGKMMLIRQALKAMIKAMSEGLSNAAAADRSIGGPMARALDKIASASATMKNSLGAAFGELLQTLQPVILYIINLVIKLANTMSQVFAILGGRSDYLKMNEVTAEWGDSAKKNAKAAKEWKNQLMGFDEINRLNDSSSSGSGSGSGSNGGGTGERELINFDGTIFGFIKDNLDLILPLVEAIGAVILFGWAFGFSLVSAGIALIVVGLLNIVGPISDFLNGLELTNGQIDQLVSGLALIALGVALILGPTAGLIALVAVIVVALYAYRDKISEFFSNLRESIYGFVEKIGSWLDEHGLTFLAGIVRFLGSIIAFISDSWALGASLISAIFGTIAQIFRGFVSGDWSSCLENIKKLWSNVWEGVKTIFKDIWNGILGILETCINGAIDLINGLLGGISWIAGLFGADMDLTISHVHFNRYADGGFPAQGELFIAREAGAEMVGNIGGHTAVANNEQIVEAVSRGVYDAVSNAMGNKNSSVNVYLDGKQISDSVTRYQRQNARAMGV